MVNESIKCSTCKRKLHYQNDEGKFVTKNCSVLETDPETGITEAVCKTCKTRVELPNLRVFVEEFAGQDVF